jgi:uncharacterized membrane protein
LELERGQGCSLPSGTTVDMLGVLEIEKSTIFGGKVLFKSVEVDGLCIGKRVLFVSEEAE